LSATALGNSSRPTKSSIRAMNAGVAGMNETPLTNVVAIKSPPHSTARAHGRNKPRRDF
jgi:hypothetical protein